MVDMSVACRYLCAQCQVRQGKWNEATGRNNFSIYGIVAFGHYGRKAGAYTQFAQLKYLRD